MARTFNTSQRIEAILKSKGHCVSCGMKLEPGWHADHKLPHSKGGPTETWNAQAMCPDCNLKKGNKYKMNIAPWSKPLRPWQKEVYGAWIDHDKPNFLMVGTPGCGKTLAALKIVHTAFENRRIERVVIVVPSIHLCEQWAESANEIGLHLDPYFENKAGVIAPDMHGVVVTYHQVFNQPKLFTHLVTQAPTGIVLDEVHHCAENKGWGNGIKIFKKTEFQLLTSGTPWRSDSDRIPFVIYEPDNGYLKNVANYTYSYLRAVRDGVCRNVIFPAYEGKMEWLKGNKYYDVTFEDELSEEEARDRLRTAIMFHMDKSWVKGVAQEAYSHLLELRENGHPDAGMLITVMGIEEAGRAEEFFRHKVGISPVVVHCDEKGAHDKIKRFAKSSEPVLISIKMVSEGVDIPRLRIGLFATNILTKLYIWQFIGRFLRMIDSLEEQTAFVYFPKDPYFVGILKEIQEEQDHIIQEVLERDKRNCAECEHKYHFGRCTEYDEVKDDICRCDYKPPPTENSFQPVMSEKTDGVMIFQANEYGDEKLIEARELINMTGASIDPTIVAAIIEEARKRDNTNQTEMPFIETTTTKRATRKKQLKGTAHILVSKIVFAIGKDKIDQRTIHGMYNKLVGVRTNQMTEEQLEIRGQVLNMILDEIRNYGPAVRSGDIRNMMAVYLEKIHADRQAD